MGFGGLAALWDPNEHPRGWHGRFVRKFKLAPWLDNVLRNFRPRQWHSNGQAGQYSFNLGHKSPGGAFNALEMKRVHTDWDEAQDHIRAGEIDPTTKQFMDTMDRHFQPAPEALIVGRTFTPDGLGLQPQQLNVNDPNGITRFMGNTLADKGYFPGHVGTNDAHGAGKITMSVAVPKGTRVAFSGQNANDRGVFLDKGQRVLVTQVNPDGQGGWYMMAVVEPKGGPAGTPSELIPGRKGAGLSPAQREARIGGGPNVMQQVAEPPRGDSTGHQLNIPAESTMPGPAQTPEKAAAAAPARAARRAGYQQARQAEGNAPQAPQPVQPTPTPPSGVGERTEPVHGPIGGVPTEGKSASEIAGTPAEPTPAAPAAAPTPEPFENVFRQSGLKSPTAGPQRREFNNAVMKARGGNSSDALRELDADIDNNEATLKSLPDGDPKKATLRNNIQHQRNLADLIATHFNEPRLHRQPKPQEALGAPEAPAPAKKAFSSVKELTPTERANYDSLDKLGKTRYLARRRAGQGHQSAFQNVKGHEAAPAAEKAPVKAAPRKGLTTAGQESPHALPPLHTAKTETPAAPTKVGSRAAGKVAVADVKKGDKILVSKHEDGTWRPATKKTGATVLTVDHRGPDGVHGKDENGNDIVVTRGTGLRPKLVGHQTFIQHQEKAPRATKATKPEGAAVLAKGGFTDHNFITGEKRATKAAKAAPAPKAVSEVQTRADAAGLPNTVTALRQAAREKKIRGFSTMNKEQLQRALLGEEVGTGGKLGPIAPDKLTGHIKAAATDQAARNLMEDHTVADLKALAKHNDVNLKGITTKDRIKDAVIKHLRGEGEGALRPTPPTESLTQQMDHNKILERGLHKEPDIRKIVDDVSPDDPDSLRSHRDELEKIAEDTKTSDPIKSRVAQEAADAMGMRAQQISGVEEAPAAKKAVKAVKKVAAPKLSVHQERVRKQALADGATEEEARAAGEAAPVRAPAGTKAATAKATAARKAAGLPESRQAQFERTGEFNPGPQQTVPKRAPKAATPAKAGVPEGPARVQPQGVRETPAPGAPFTPESERKLRAAGMEPGVPGRGRIQSRDLKPGDRVMVERDSEGNLVPEMVRGDKAAFPVDVVKQNPDGSVQVKDDAGKLHDTVPEAPRGTSYRPETPTEARRAAKATKKAAPSKVTKGGIPAADEAKFKAAGVKPNKVVPQGSVKGERAQTPIDNNFRAHEFDAAYMKHVDKRGNISDHAVESQDQVAADISEGRITPEEGIRRIESEIAFNNDEIGNLSRDIRSGNLEGAQLDQARHDLNALERDNASHEMLSRDLHQHFGKERVTAPEVAEKIKQDNPGFWEGLNKQDPEELRRAIQENPDTAHLGPIQGNTTQEVFQDALKKIIKNELDKRAAAKEGRAAKAAKKAAPRVPGAPPPPAPKPDFAPGGAKHLDAKAIAGDLNVPEGILASTQEDLNSGTPPSQVAGKLRHRAGRIRDSGAMLHASDAITNFQESPEQKQDRENRLQQARDSADKLDQFAERLKGTRRPTVRKAAAAKATEDVQAAKEVTKEPAAKKALAKAETSVRAAEGEAEALKQRVVGRHHDAWNKSTTAKEAEAAGAAMRQDLTLAEIRDFFGQQGITGRSKDDILKKAVERRFGSGGDISPEKVRGPSAAQKVNSRFEESARLKGTGGAFANLDEAIANGGSERVIRHRVDTGNFGDEATKAQVMKAALAGDRSELDRLAREQHGLTRNTGAPGNIEPFEPGKHRAITGSHRKGEAVRIVQPGYQGTVEGRAFQAHPATVLAATPEEKKAMLDRLANQKREAIAGLPAETRAAVLARSARQTQSPQVQRLAKKAAAGKAGITPPAPLPTNKAEEVAGNMARLNAAKAKTFDPADIRAQLGKATTHDEARQILRGLTISELKQIDPDAGRISARRADLESAIIIRHSKVARVGDMAKGLIEPLPIPGKKGATVGELKTAAREAPAPTKATKAAKAVATANLPPRQHPNQIEKQLNEATSTEEGDRILSTLPQSRAQYKAMAEKVGVETAPNDTMKVMHDKILRQAVTRRLEHAAYLRRANPVTSTGAPEHGKLEGAVLAKSTPAAALPTRGPIKRASLHFDEGMSPAKLGREDGNTPLKAPNGSWQSDQGLIHMDSEIGQLWQDLAKDNRLPNSDLNKITTIGQDLGRGNISTKQAATELNGIRNGLTDGPVKDRFTEAVRGLDVKPTEYSVPDNTPKEVRDWLDHINAIPAFHNKAPNQGGSQGPTPFERAVALVRDIGEGKVGPGGDMKLTQAAHNVHESGDGVYQARKEGDKLFFPGSGKMSPEVRDWLRSYRNQPEATPAKATPAKATKAAKKAAPAKVTQAELRNPVAKVGNAAPSATPREIQATGLKAGEGLPTSAMLSARNKLGTGNSGTLTKLDTAVRIPARHGDIPGLLKNLEEQLQRAGVGPNDEPRKTLVAFFREHFKV